jgi:hypothetical protein
MEKVDFFALPRTLQERILGGIEGRFPPMPMLSKRLRPAPPWKWVGLVIGSIVLVLILHRIGFGDLNSRLAHHPVWLLPIYAALFIAAFFGLLSSLAVYVRLSRLPYPAGVYVYSARALDARSHPMVSLPISELETIESRGDEVVLKFAGYPSLSASADPQNMASAVVELEQNRARASQNGAESNPDSLALIDPLFQPRFSNPVGESVALSYNLPPWVRFNALFAIALGALLGFGTFALRNRASDSKLFENACQVGSATAFRQYLSAGSSHADEVERTRLPRAELLEAKSKGTIEALLGYEAAHPRTDIGTEIAQAKRKAYLEELEKAKTPRTLAALLAFREKYPKHGLEPELQAAMHALYQEAQSKVGTTKGLAPDAGAFLTKLIAYAETQGAAVELRIRRREGATMTRVDKEIAKVSEYMGEVSRPTKYFDEAHDGPRQKALVAEVLAAFGAAFPKELLAVRSGEAIPDSKDLPAFSAPTLVITTFQDWSGHTFMFKKPRGAFIGIYFNYEVEFVIPKSTAAYRNKLVLFRPVSSAQIRDLEAAPRLNPPLEEIVYETMSTEARKQFVSKFAKSFLGETTLAEVQQKLEEKPAVLPEEKKQEPAQVVP